MSGLAAPRVDVLIPAYNAADTIESAVASIQNQTVRDIRIVVVDDGSTDETASILSRVAAADPRIETVRRSNGGIVDALNHGLSLCRAPFVARHDGDDLAHPDRLAKQLAFLDDHPGCVAVGGAVRHIDERGQPLGHVARFGSPENADPISAPSREPYIVHPVLTARRHALVAAGGYRYAFHAEDTDLYWRLQEHGTLHNLDDVVADYRLHAGSVSSRSLLNGRISAVNSQLAGLSAKRRRDGRPDLAFPKDALARDVAAGSLAGMVRARADALDPAEADRLAIMTAAKLMFLATFRPFELDLEDCRFIAGAVRHHAGLLAPDNRRGVETVVWSTAARLASRRRLREALALASPRDYHRVAARIGFRALTSPALRRLVRRGANRPDYVK